MGRSRRQIAVEKGSFFRVASLTWAPAVCWRAGAVGRRTVRWCRWTRPPWRRRRMSLCTRWGATRSGSSGCRFHRSCGPRGTSSWPQRGTCTRRAWCAHACVPRAPLASERLEGAQGATSLPLNDPAWSVQVAKRVSVPPACKCVRRGLDAAARPVNTNTNSGATRASRRRRAAAALPVAPASGTRARRRVQCTTS